MRNVLLSLLLLISFAPSLAAEWRVQLPTSDERRGADIASWVTIASALALDTNASWRCSARVHCFAYQGVRLGVTYGVTYLVKTAIHRDRPCAPDNCGVDQPNASFYSAHTAGAFQALGGPRLAFALPLALSTGGLRVAAGKHWMSDTLVGAGVGFLTSKIR